MRRGRERQRLVGKVGGGSGRSMDTHAGALRSVAGNANAGRSTEVSRPASDGPVTARGPF
jgi:hypothetical protein